MEKPECPRCKSKVSKKAGLVQGVVTKQRRFCSNCRHFFSAEVIDV